jgi:hypothetical protein
MVAPCSIEDLGGSIEPAHPARCHSGGEVLRDAARTATDVEQIQAGPQERDEIRGRILDRPPSMRPQDALVMAMCVHGDRAVRRSHW